MRASADLRIRSNRANPVPQHCLEKVPHYWGAQRVYWGVLRPSVHSTAPKAQMSLR